MHSPSFPTTVDLAITGKCNLRCRHCNTSDTWTGADEFSFEELVSVLDRLKEEKIFYLTVFGGEPFLHPRIHEFIRLVSRYPFRVTFLTNGTLIDQSIAQELKAMRFLDVVQVSIDGSSSEIHDWQRGEGSFEKAMKGLGLLMKNTLPVKIKAVINAQNRGDMADMVKMAIGLGLDGMDFGDAIECGRAAVHSSSMRFEGGVYRDIMEKMFELKNNYPGFSFGGTLAQKMKMLEDFYADGPGKGKRGTFSTCPAGHSMISIRADGKVVPCSAFWTLISGDMRKEALKDIWERSEVLNSIRALADEPLTSYCRDCASCDYLSHCNGGCRASAYYSAGKRLDGIDRRNCLVFSGMHGFRVPEGRTIPAGKSEYHGCM